jgi:hypothetical protein
MACGLAFLLLYFTPEFFIIPDIISLMRKPVNSIYGGLVDRNIFEEQEAETGLSYFR